MQHFFSGFRRFLRVLGVATILATLAVSAWADDAWHVTKVSGTARLNQGDGTWTSVTVGAVVAPGGIVETGANGRVVLKSDKDEATMSPNSRVVAPKPSEAKDSNLVQKLGTLLFKIERAPSRRFAVDTPYLAAVVKGTTFTVTVGADSGVVQVTEGAVLVASFGSRETALVTPGQTAQVLAAGGKLQVIGRGQSLPVAPRANSGSGDTQDKKSSKDVDPADQKLIEKGHVALAQAIADEAGDKGKGNDKGIGTVSAKSDRLTEVASLDGGSAGHGKSASSVVVIAKALGVESIDVARATNGLIAGIPAESVLDTKGNGTSSKVANVNTGSDSSNAGGNGNGNGTSVAVAVTSAPEPAAAATPATSTAGLLPLGGALPAVSTPTAAVVASTGNGVAGADSNAGGNGNGNGVAGGNGNGNGGASAPAAAAPAPTVSAPPVAAPAPTVSTPTVDVAPVAPSAPIIPPPAAPVVNAPVVTPPAVVPSVVTVNVGVSSPGQGLAKGKNK